MIKERYWRVQNDFRIRCIRHGRLDRRNRLNDLHCPENKKKKKEMHEIGEREWTKMLLCNTTKHGKIDVFLCNVPIAVPNDTFASQWCPNKFAIKAINNEMKAIASMVNNHWKQTKCVQNKKSFVSSAQKAKFFKNKKKKNGKSKRKS